MVLEPVQRVLHVEISAPLTGMVVRSRISGDRVEMLTLTSQDHREALAAFLEKRKPKFNGL